MTELVQGTTRRLRSLDHVLDRVVKGGVTRLTPPIRNNLRLAAYQLLFTAIAPHAVVHEAVALAGRFGHRGVAGLTNAVLRRLQREGQGLLPGAGTGDAAALALLYSLPDWIVETWVSDRGLDEARHLAEQSAAPLPLTLRIRPGGDAREVWIDRLAEVGVTARPARWLSEALILETGSAVPELPGFEDGAWTVQGEGAMLASRVLDPRPGDTIVDLAAAPGGKTAHLHDLLSGRGRLVAIDVHPGRLRVLERNLARLAIDGVEVREGDARQVRDLEADRVLLDAPCSGLGVLARKADLRWRFKPADLPGLLELQAGMLDAAAALVRPGGVLVYATCTVNRAENEAQVEAFLRRRPGFRLEAWPPVEGGLWPPGSETGMIQLTPHEHGVEGFFVARLVRATGGESG